jgi:hypothetical protein
MVVVAAALAAGVRVALRDAAQQQRQGSLPPVCPVRAAGVRRFRPVSPRTARLLWSLAALLPVLPQQAACCAPAGNTTCPTRMTSFPQRVCTTRCHVERSRRSHSRRLGRPRRTPKRSPREAWLRRRPRTGLSRRASGVEAGVRRLHDGSGFRQAWPPPLPGVPTGFSLQQSLLLLPQAVCLSSRGALSAMNSPAGATVAGCWRDRILWCQAQRRSVKGAARRPHPTPSFPRQGTVDLSLPRS